jgi:SAM-dependent methyltransferase
MKSVPSEFNPSLIHHNFFIRNALLRSIKKLSPILKGKMMDFGCGQKPYKNVFDVDEYIGVDFENPGHPHLNESIDVFYDGKKLPFPDAHFDSVFSSEVFEHIFNLQEIIMELNRVLKPNGYILITCPFTYCEHEIPNDYARYSSYGMTNLFTSRGFEIVQSIKTGNSIEAIMQLWATYIHLNILPVFKHIPVVRTLARAFIFGLNNGFGLLLGKILPSGKELYMNNVFLCRKTSVQ